MSSHVDATPSLLSRARRHVVVDRRAIVLILLTVVVQVGAWAAYLAANQHGLQLPDRQVSDLSFGVGGVGLIVVESVVIVAAFRIWKWSGDWFKMLVKTGVVAIALVGLWRMFVAGQLWMLLPIVGVAVIDQALAVYDLDWITFNALALALGIGMTALVGSLVAPVVLIPAMVLMLAWDHVAVNLSDIMGDLVEFSSSVSIPNYIVIPDGWTVDFESVSDFVADGLDGGERPDGLGGIIGVGDFVFPAALTISAAVAVGESFGVVAWGSLVGTLGATLVLSAALERSDGGLPALPWLNTGAILGFAAGASVSGVPVVTALGIQGGVW